MTLETGLTKTVSTDLERESMIVHGSRQSVMDAIAIFLVLCRVCALDIAGGSDDGLDGAVQ